MEALALLPLPGDPHRQLSGRPLRLCGDGGELLLHSQHLAHAYCRQRWLPSSTTCQARWESGAPGPPKGLRVSAVCERAGGAGLGGSCIRLHKQHLHKLIGGSKVGQSVGR